MRLLLSLSRRLHKAASCANPAASKIKQVKASGPSMSTGIATVVLLGIELALLVPLVLAWFRPRLLRSVPLIYGLAALALGLHQTGLIRNDLPAGLDAADLSPAPLDDDRCAEMIDALKQAGAVSQDSRPGDVEISPELWEQIPEQIREAIAPCIESGDSTQI
jgi:hypothetical protein